MQDRTPLYPGRVKLIPVEGQANVYDMTREDSPTQPGSPMSKATFLKDATAALYGLDDTAVPDDVLNVLSRFNAGLGNEYVWEKSNDTGIIGYVNSPDSNAYPPAEDDGYTYTAMGQLGAKARIATGSYIGTGNYGADAPNTLTFNFVPRLIFFPAVSAATSFAPHYAIAMQGSTALPVPGASTACNITWDSNSVSWYYGGDVPVGGSGPKLQMNVKNAVYPYIAIG